MTANNTRAEHTSRKNSSSFSVTIHEYDKTSKTYFNVCVYVCVRVPTLFDLFFSVVVSTWRDDCDEVGIDVLSHPGRKVVGDRTAKSRLNVAKVTESQCVDDLALYASTCDKLDHVTTDFVRWTGQWGLTVSILKTKDMASGKDLGAADTAPLWTVDGEIEMVSNFTYLGSVISSDGEISEVVKCRLAKASQVLAV